MVTILMFLLFTDQPNKVARFQRMPSMSYTIDTLFSHIL